jgi:hypothetical protein
MSEQPQGQSFRFFGCFLSLSKAEITGKRGTLPVAGRDGGSPEDMRQD